MKYFFTINKSHLSRQRAFTMVEMIIYVSLLAIIVGVLVSTTVVMVKSYKEMRIAQLVDSSAILALDRITSVVRSSNNIDFGYSTFNSSAGVLTLNANLPNNAPYIAKFYVEEGVVKLDTNGVFEGQLTSSSTRVVSLMFRYITTLVSKAIRTEITLTTNVNGVDKSENYYTTTILKNSY